MINVGTLSKLRRMVHRDGISVREASKRLGIARNTAARWLAMNEMVEPKYPKRESVDSILDPYKEHLVSWLKSDGHRGKRERRTTKSLYESIRALGYSGSRGPVYAFCKQWRDDQINKPRHAGFVPMTYELGEAFQFDLNRPGSTRHFRAVGIDVFRTLPEKHRQTCCGGAWGCRTSRCN